MDSYSYEVDYFSPEPSVEMEIYFFFMNWAYVRSFCMFWIVNSKLFCFWMYLRILFCFYVTFFVACMLFCRTDLIRSML